MSLSDWRQPARRAPLAANEKTPPEKIRRGLMLRVAHVRKGG
jgi:hypothetical protein